jgi:hypothetical protein
MTDDGHQVMAKAHFAFRKVQPNELKLDYEASMEDPL